MSEKYNSLHEQVKEYVTRDQIERIDSVIRQALRTRPDDPIPLCLAGIEMVCSGYTEPGFDTLLEALVRFPKHSFVYFSLGYAHDHREKREEALACFRRCLELRYDFRPALLSATRLFLDAEDWESALYHQTRFLERFPDDYEIRSHFAIASGELYGRERGIQIMESILSEHPNFHDGRYSLGLMLYREGRYAESIEQYRLLVANRPENASDHFRLALALEHNNQYRAARESYLRAHQIAPENPTYKKYALRAKPWNKMFWFWRSYFKETAS